MKLRTSLMAALVVLAVGVTSAPAQSTIYWDLNGTDEGSGGPAPSGAWNTSDQNWNDTADGTGAAAVFAAGDHVHFSAGTDATGAYAITADAGMAPGSMTIEEGRVVLAGSAIQMGTNPVLIRSIVQIPSSVQVAISSGQVTTLDGGTIRNTHGAGVGSGTWSGLGTIELTANGGGFDVINGGTGTYSIMAYTGTIVRAAGVNTATFVKKGTAEQRLRNVNTFTTLDVQNGLLRIDGTGGSDLSLGDPNGTVIAHGGAVTGTTSGSALGTSVTVTSPATRSFVLNTTNGPDTMFVTNANWTINGNISGPGGIIHNGWVRTDTNAVIGTQNNIILGGNNTFGGDILINFGSVVAANGSAIPDTANIHISTDTTYGATTTFNTAVFQLNNSETIRQITGGTHTAGGAAANRGNVNLTANSILTLGHSGDFTYSGNMTGNGGINKVGAGTMTIEHYDYTNTGPMTISAGKVRFGNAAAGFGTQSVVSIASGAELDMNSVNDTFGALAGAGTVNRGTAANITLGAASGTNTFSGTMTGTGNLTKGRALPTGAADNATQILAGNYSVADLTVNAGTLLSNGAVTTSGAVAVNGGRLGGTGSVSGVASVNSGGGIAPGAVGAIGTFTLGGATLASGSILDFHLGAPGTSDLLVLSQANGLTIDGGTLNLADAGGFGAGTYTLMDYAGSLGGSLSNLMIGTTPDNSLSYSLVNNTGDTTIQLLVQAAAPANTADFNRDGVIDAADYVVWRKFNPTTGGATQETGDANGDGNVDATDEQIWTQTFGNTIAGSGGGLGGGDAVPEPASAMLLLIGLAAMAAGRRSR